MKNSTDKSIHLKKNPKPPPVYCSAPHEGEPCSGISAEACRIVRHSFIINFLARTLTQIGDRLINPKTTLVWLCSSLGVPSFFEGILVPLRESGSMLPQVFIAAWIKRRNLRKHIWALGNLLQALCILPLAAIPFFLKGTAAGWAITALIAGFSLSRGLSSIAAKDVLGKTIPKARRGRLTGYIASTGGLVAMVAGAALWLPTHQKTPTTGGGFTWILCIGAGLWLISVLLIEGIREFPESPDSDRSDEEADTPIRKLVLLSRDEKFRNFVIVRALAIGSALSAPFIISLAHETLGGKTSWLGVFILIDGLSAMLSSPFWGRLSDRSSRFVLILAMALTTALLILTVGFSQFHVTGIVATIFYPTVFFLLGIAHSGVRLGRKTYIVDMADGNQRTDYVSVSNTAIGLLLLLMGGITSLISLLSVSGALLVFAVCSGLGSLLAIRLPEVSR